MWMPPGAPSAGGSLAPIIEKHQQGEALGAGRGVEALTVKHP